MSRVYTGRESFFTAASILSRRERGTTRSVVEREAPALTDRAPISPTSGASLSDPALPGNLSLRERDVSLDLMQASVPDGPG